MVCSANDSSITQQNPPPLPSVPGFGIPVAPVNASPQFEIPPFLDDLTSYVSQLGAFLPSGTFKPFPDSSMHTIYDALSNLLSQLAPYLSLYNLFTAVLKMFKCIIDILCAIPSPFLVAEKLIVLFSQCLPDLLSIFPVFLLPRLIISLLILILALITYIIDEIFGLIEQIIHNIEVMQNGLQLNDATSLESAINKIAELLCTMQSIFAMFISLASVMAIIESLANLAGFLFCSDSDEDGCCDPSVCPSFLKNTPNGISAPRANLRYFKQIGFDSASALGLPPEIAAAFSIPPIRRETWQVWDTINNAEYKISDIITPLPPQFNIFYPDETTYSKDTPLKQAPYSADIRIFLNLEDFGLEPSGYSPLDNQRYFRILNCIVVAKPYVGVLDFDGELDDSLATSGTLCIEGGLVYEDDGVTPFLLANGSQATLNTFIHQDGSSGTTIPISDDSIDFSTVELNWKPNVPALAGLNLTTVGCVPEVSIEKATLNSMLTTEGIEAVSGKIPATPAGQAVPSTGVLPNISGTLSCLNSALASFRTNVSTEGAADFTAQVTTCLTDLQNQTNSTLCSVLLASVSKFKTTFTLSPNLQFTTLPIKIIVDLKDATGTSLGIGLTSACIPLLENKLSADVSFGTVSKFTYDGSQYFVALINSDNLGGGSVTVSYDNNILSVYSPSSATNPTPSITEQSLPYSFVASLTNSPVRRDATDVALSGKA